MPATRDTAGTSRPRRRRLIETLAAAGALVCAVAGCGDGARDAPAAQDPGASVAVERATFASHQHVGQRSTLTLAVRNAGAATIADLVVTLRGLRDRAAGRDAWLLDEPPLGVTASDDTWTAGALAPGKTATLRWAVTPVVAGTRDLRYEVSASLSARSPATLAAGGRARGTLTVRVSDRPAQARVDPETGDVIRRE